MPQVSLKVTIPAQISAVFSAATAYDAPSEMKQWRTGIESINLTAANPLQVGSMIAIRRQFLGNTIFVNADVMAYERNKRFDLRGIHGRFPFTRHIEFVPNGRETVVNDTVDVNVGWLFFWWSPFVSSALQKQLKQEWTALAEQLG